MLLSPSHTISLCLIFSPSLGLCHLTKQVFPDTFRYFVCVCGVCGGAGPCLHVYLMCTHKDQKRVSDPPELESLMMWVIMLVLGTEPGFSATAPNPWTNSPTPRFLNWFSSPWTCKSLEEDSACLLTAVPLHTERCPARSIWELLVDWRNSFSEAITGTWHMMQTTASIPKRVWTGKTRSSLGNQYFSSEVRI